MNICERLCRLNPSTNIGRGTVQTFLKQAGSMKITLNSHCTGSIFCYPEPVPVYQVTRLCSTILDSRMTISVLGKLIQTYKVATSTKKKKN